MTSSSKTQCTLHRFRPIFLKALRAQHQSTCPAASLSLKDLANRPGLERFPSETWYAVLELLDFETKLQLKLLSKAWRNFMQTPAIWSKLDLTSDRSVDGVPDLWAKSTCSRFMPGVGNVIGLCQGTIVHIFLPPGSPLNQERHALQLAQALSTNLRGLRSFAADNQLTGPFLNQYLPLMQNLRRLRLIGLGGGYIDGPHWPGHLSLPPCLEELSIHDSEIPREFKCESPSRLRLLNLMTARNLTDPVLYLDLLWPFKDILQVLKLESLDLRREPPLDAHDFIADDGTLVPYNPDEWEEDQLHEMIALESLELKRCTVDLPGQLPSSLKSLVMHNCRVTDETLVEWSLSSVPSLQHLHLSETSGPTWAFLSCLLTQSLSPGRQERRTPVNLQSFTYEWAVSNFLPSNSAFAREDLRSILQQHGSTLQELTIIDDHLLSKCAADIAAYCSSLSALHLESSKLEIRALHLMLFRLGRELRKLRLDYVGTGRSEDLEGLRKVCELRGIDHWVW